MITNRDITTGECPWLDEDIKKGTVVYEYEGCTYGCIGKGMACTLIEGEDPFFELPIDCLSKS